MTKSIRLVNKNLCYTLLLFLVFACSSPETNYWTKFRGADGLGIDTNKKAPVKWELSDFRWEVSLPGNGNASPVAWGDKIFVTSADDEKDLGFLIAVNAQDGKILWQKKFKVSNLSMHKDNKLAFSTPAVDKSQVFMVWYTKEKTYLKSINHNGTLQWEVEFDGIICRHGGGSSLMLTDKYVVFTREQEDFSPLKSSWIAVQKKDGKTVWEIGRNSPENNSFSTPLLLKSSNGQSQLIFASQSHGVTGVELETGKVLWERPNILPSRVVASPFYVNGKLIVTRNGETLVLDLDSTTFELADSIGYTIPRNLSPYVPTSIVVGELLFLFKDNGSIACVQLDTGELLWKERPAGAIYGSPICVDGNLYCITKEGEVIVIQADPTYQLLAINKLGEGSFSTPIMCNYGMVFRTFTKLKLLGNYRE